MNDEAQMREFQRRLALANMIEAGGEQALAARAELAKEVELLEIQVQAAREAWGFKPTTKGTILGGGFTEPEVPQHLAEWLDDHVAEPSGLMD